VIEGESEGNLEEFLNGMMQSFYEIMKTRVWSWWWFGHSGCSGCDTDEWEV